MHALVRLTSLLLFCCIVPSSAQQWSRAYGGPGSELGKFIEPTRDGGFFVAGTQSEVQQGPERYYVGRFDSTGDKLWEKTYGREGLTHTLFAFSTTRDGGYMLGGFTGVQFSGTESALMYRADSNGNVVFETDVDYDDSDHWHLLLERADGGYYMGGHTDSKGDARGDMWLQKLDSQRQVIWEKVYDRNTSEHAHSGIVTRDGGVLLLGHTEAGGREKYWVVKVDSAGSVEWQKVYGSIPNNHDSPYKVLETAEGNFAFFGGSSDPTGGGGTMWLLVVDPDGDIVIDEHYGAAGAQTFSWAGRQTSDGGFILAGFTTYRTRGQTDLLLVKTDSLGRQEWEEKRGGTGYDYAFDVIETPSGYIAAGYTGSPSIMTGGGGDLYIVKIAHRVVEAPAAVVLVSPTQAATVPAGVVTLAWAPATPDADRYRLDIAADASFASGTVDSTITATSVEISTLEAGKTYWWRVRAHNEGGWGPYSEVRSFSVIEVSSSPIETNDGIMRLVIAPNPAGGSAALRYRLARSTNVTISIIDQRGSLVERFDAGMRTSGEHIQSVDLTTLAPGMYVVRLDTDDGGAANIPISVVR